MDEAIPEGFELVNCPGCGASGTTPVRIGKDWVLEPHRDIYIVRCNQCGLNFTNPRPDAQHIGAYYPSDYAPYQRQKGEIDRHSGLHTWVLAAAYGSPAHKPYGWHAMAASIATAIKGVEHFGFGMPYEGEGRLLDFGCGNGTFLRRMAAVGWKVTGMDMSPDAVAAVKASGIPAYLGTLPHPELREPYFDAVTLRASLEHVPNPAEVLTAVHQILRPGGKVFISVPNFDSWEIRYFGDAAMTLELPRHLIHFTPPTLGDLLRRCGFKDVQVKPISKRGWIHKSVAQIQRRGKQKWDSLLRIKPVVSLVARWAQLRGQGNELTAIARKP